MEVTSAIPQEALRSIVQRTLDEMARVTAGSDGFVQNLIERLALEAYRAGTLDTLTELLTAGQAAARLSMTPRRIRALGRSRGLGLRVGREMLFHPADLEVLKER